MIFGPLPPVIPILHLGDLVVELVSKFKLPLSIFSVPAIDAIIAKVSQVVNADLQLDINHLQKTHLLRNRFELVEDKLQLVTCRRRHYLSLVLVPAHRKMLTGLLLGDHTLSVERLCYPVRYCRAIPREERLCRFCRGAVEDEVHALLGCDAHGPLTELREDFLSDAFECDPVLEAVFALLTHYDFLRQLVSSRKAIARFAKFVCQVLNLYDRYQRYIPDGYSNPATMWMPAFPPEVLMRIFSYIKDNESFSELALTSRQFNVLGREEQTRNKYWQKAEDVQPRIARWRTSPQWHLLKDLNIHLADYSDDMATQNIAALDIFSNLSALTIRNGRITPIVHAALMGLMSLMSLRLMWCLLCVVDRAAPAPPTPFTVTSPVLHAVHVMDRSGERLDDLTIGALCVRGLVLIPVHLLHGLQSLSISSDQSASRVIRQGHALLPDAHNLVHLSAVAPPSAYNPEPRPASAALVLSALTSFVGPRCLAGELMHGAGHLAALTGTNEITTLQALDILAALTPHAMRSIEMTLTRWADEVLYEIVHRFAACKRVRLIYRYLGPSDVFLFHAGHHLERMPVLNMLLLHARPEDTFERVPHPSYYGYSVGEYFQAKQKWEADGAAGMRAVPPPPNEVQMWEYLAVWTRYNPRLEVISVGAGERLWTRAFRGRVWSLGA
ncbi:hypothetical protein B0H17DRAFT_1134752 [Mycena rosella]|uniref:F-box domain-containing protein n=1 Tax=Mycena rosella TaxID=1033263 RepID=A0AAD7DHN1_MYCRO|nr:hypothetical protein B0H17DRAFT_1134752 [Mycena rosella]